MIKRLLMSLVLVLAPLGVLAAGEAEPASGTPVFQEGVNYDLINPPLRTSDPGRIEVTEFFWYGCGHCYHFEPMVEQWKKTLAEDVAFRPSPAVWNPSMELHSKAFYTAEVLGVLDTMHPALFHTMNVERKRLKSEEEIAEQFTAKGVSAEEFSKAFNSFGVGSQVRQANSRARSAKITGTPSMMVDGKYLITAQKAGSQANMLKVADFLIEKERVARSQ